MDPEQRFNTQHQPAGAATGGQFASGGGGASQQQKAKTRPAASAQHAKPKPHHSQYTPTPAGQMGFDGRHGTGYGIKGGDPKVRRLQHDLNRLGLTDAASHPLAVDGKFGPKTTAAVKAAQTRLGLTPTGKVTPELMARLTAAHATPAKATPKPAVAHHKPPTTAPAKRPAAAPPKLAAAVAPQKQHGPLRPGGAVARAAPGITVTERSRPDLFEEVGRTVAAVERRFTNAVAELRGVVDDQPRIGGYAAKFNQRSRNLGGFVERVGTTFFDRSRGNDWPDVLCRYNHDDNQLLGTTGARTLNLRVDTIGLDYEVAPPKAATMLIELVQRGDVQKSSFAFRVPTGGDEWDLDADTGYPLRSLTSGILVDVAPVNTPAYVETTLAIRALRASESATAEHQVADMRRLGIGPEAALRSLAARMSAAYEDVLALAEADELRKFFIRTDGGTAKPVPRTLGAAAAVQLLARRTDPWA